MWDRFGTTFEQELKATCDKHLVERLADMIKWAADDKLKNVLGEEQPNYLDKVKDEIERRKLDI